MPIIYSEPVSGHYMLLVVSERHFANFWPAFHSLWVFDYCIRFICTAASGPRSVPFFY